jgi:hypothetical protein
MDNIPISNIPSSDAALTEPARILNTFFAPSRTFCDLERNASWWGPFVLAVLATLLFIFTIDRQVGFDQITKNEIAKSSRAEQFDKLPADQKAKQMEFATTITRYISYASPIFVIVGYLVVAGVLLALSNLGAGAGLRFKVAMAIAAYGGLPWLVHALLGIASMMAGVDKDGFDIKNPVGSNPAYFMEAAGNKFVQGMASAFDIFSIWSIVLIGIGLACNSKIKRSTAILLVAGAFLFYKLIGSSLAALTG